MEYIDVVIVGAGMSGLRTASLLKRSGYSVKVLEALDRVGGRLKGVKDKDGYIWDVGGQWVGPQQVLMKKVLEEYKIPVFPQCDDGVGKMVVLSDHPPKKFEVSGGEQVAYSAVCLEALNKMAAELGNYWWEHPKAAEWDSVTVEQWVNTTFPNEKNNCYATPTGTQALIAAEENQVSLLYLLVWLNRCTGVNGEPGTFDNLLNIKGGAQEWIIGGSAWGVCNTIHQKELKDIVRLNSPVSKIYHDDHGVTVVTSDGYICRALHAVITAPPNVINKITFFPAIPTRRRLNECFPMGSVIKGFVKYESAYWHIKGFSGLSVGLQTGDVAYTSDGTVTLPNGKIQAAIIFFILGDAARRWSEKSPAERKKMVLHSLVNFFDEPRMWSPQDYLEQDWCSEEYQGGGYLASTPPGILSSYGRSLYTPIGRLHWAGTEAADRWPGYMEGAVSSAERVVSEILRHPRERPKL